MRSSKKARKKNKRKGSKMESEGLSDASKLEIKSEESEGLSDASKLEIESQDTEGVFDDSKIEMISQEKEGLSDASKIEMKSLENEEITEASNSELESSYDDDQQIKNEPPLSQQEDGEEPVVLETVDITPEKSNGVLKQIIQPGEGDESPGHGDRVSVYYTGYLLTKERPVQFETNRGQEKCEFSLGRGMVIKGWDMGIATMKKSEVALFIIQPEYAYGIMGNPPKIPAHTPLLFEVELCGWKYEDLSPKKDGSILRKTLEVGEGVKSPNEGAQVKVKLTGYYNDTVFEDCEKEFILGQGCTVNVLEAVETALCKFHLKERSLIFLTGKSLIDNRVEALGIPKDTDVKYEITLLSFEKVKDVWEMNTDEKFAKAVEAKEKGIEFLKAGHFKVALRQFKLIVMCLENEPGAPPGEENSRKSLLLSGYLNLVLCLMKLENYTDAIKNCEKALELDPDNEKALFRKAQSRMFLNDCDEALEDFKTLCTVYPENKAAKQSLLLCQEKIKKQKLKDQGIYNKMFEKFVKQDEERMRNMKTETGVWQNDKKEEKKYMNETERLIECSDSFLRDANIIELSNTVTNQLNV